MAKSYAPVVFRTLEVDPAKSPSRSGEPADHTHGKWLDLTWVTQ
jgi:hypothetical protein